MISGASSQTAAVDSVFMFIVGVSIFFLILITFLMIYFIVKYNKKRNTKAKDIHGNTALEITWTVIPTIVVLFMFYFGWKGFEYLRNAPKDSMSVKVTAQMWKWSFEYENGVKTDTLRVPINKPVKLVLNSLDVIHSFYVPAFRIKEDAVPGMQNHLWFNANEVGKYHVLCAEYCGLNHAYMQSSIDAVPEDEFNTWYAQMGQQVKKAASGSETDSGQAKQPTAADGARLVEAHACLSCHTTDGSKSVGPSWKGLYGSKVTVETGGKEREVTADEEYIRRSILDPQADIVKGFPPIMPSQKGQLTEQELVAIIQYIKGLK